MNILGLDSGMLRLGIGVVKVEEGEISLVTYGMIYHPRDPAAKFNDYLNQGIIQITDSLPRLIDLTSPALMAGETVPAGKLGSSDGTTIAAITACKVIAHQFGIEWMDVAANTVKKRVTGDDKATKTAIRNAVFKKFPIIEHRHLEMKKMEKLAGEKAEGLPFDVFDGVAVSLTAAMIHEGIQDLS